MVELALAGVVPSVEGSEDDCFEKQEKEPHLLHPDLPYFPGSDGRHTPVLYQNKRFDSKHNIFNFVFHAMATQQIP